MVLYFCSAPDSYVDRKEKKVLGFRNTHRGGRLSSDPGTRKSGGCVVRGVGTWIQAGK